MPNEDINEKAIEVVPKELEDRRAKLWEIFSWSNSVLISITGGILVLETVPQRLHVFSGPEFTAITVAVVAITYCATRWLSYNFERVEEIVKVLNDKLDIKQQLGISLEGYPSKRWFHSRRLWFHFGIGYRLILWSLTFAAAVVTSYGSCVRRRGLCAALLVGVFAVYLIWKDGARLEKS